MSLLKAKGALEAARHQCGEVVGMENHVSKIEEAYRTVDAAIHGVAQLKDKEEQECH